MVACDFPLRQILLFITVNGVVSQWPGGSEMMGGPGQMLGLEPGLISGMGELTMGLGMNGPGMNGPGMNVPGRAQGRVIPEYNEMPYHARPPAARYAQAQWNQLMNPQVVPEKPKKYKFPDGRPAQNGQDKNAWKKMKTSLDRTLTPFSNGQQRRPNPNQGRLQQNRVQNNNARQSRGPNNQLRRQLRVPQNQQLQRQQMIRQTNNAQGRGFRNLRPVGPQNPQTGLQGRPAIPLKSTFPQRTKFTQPKPPGATPIPRNLAKGRPMSPSMLPPGSIVPVRQPLTMISQNARQTGFVPQQTRQMNTYPGMIVQGTVMSGQTSIQGISQANAKPMSTMNRFGQSATQPGVYDTRGVKAPPGYTQFIPNVSPRKKPMIESMRKAVQNGEQIIGNASKAVSNASSNKNSTTLEALTQAAEGPSLRNVKVQPNPTIRSGIPSTLAPIGVTTPQRMYGVTQGPFLDTFGTNTWDTAPTTSVYGTYYSATGTQGLYDPYNFATDVPHTLHYSHQSNLNIKQAGSGNPIPTGQDHQRLLQQQELRQKQINYERQQQQMMIHRQQYEKQYIAKQQQYMQATTSTAPPTERTKAPPSSVASLRRSEKVPVAVEMVTSTLTVPTQPLPTSTTTVPTTTTIKKIETTTNPTTTTTQAPSQTTTRIVPTQQRTDPSTRLPPPGAEDRMGVRPKDVDPNPDPNGPRPIPTQQIVPQTPTFPPGTTQKGSTGSSQGTTTLTNSTETPLQSTTVTTTVPPVMSTKTTQNLSEGTPSTMPPTVSSSTQSPTTPPVTELITKTPVVTTTDKGVTNDLTNSNLAPSTDGQNNVIDKNKLSVPTSIPSLAEQQSKPRDIQQNGIQIDLDPPNSETLPAYHLANAPRDQVNNQFRNSLSLAQNGQRFNLPSPSPDVNLNKARQNYNNGGMLTVQQQQRSGNLPNINRMQNSNMLRSAVPYNTLQFSQQNSLLGQRRFSQSNVMRQGVRSAVQPLVRGPMPMQQRGSIPKSGFQGINQNVQYQYPGMSQGMDTTIYQNPSQLGTGSRFPQMTQSNIAGGSQAQQMSFAGRNQRFAGQTMNQNGRWAVNRQVGPRGLSAQGHSKHSAKLSNRPNPDMSLLSVMQKRGALFRSASPSTANAKTGHLAMTLSKDKNKVAGPRVDSLKLNIESKPSTNIKKDTKSTTMSTSKPTTTPSTKVATTENTSTTTHIPTISQGNLVIIQKLQNQQTNSSVEKGSSKGHLNIIRKRIQSSIDPMASPSPRDILTESNQELSRRLNGQLFVAQRRRISPQTLPRLRTNDVKLSRNSAINQSQRRASNVLRANRQRLAAMQSRSLHQRQILAQRSRQMQASNRRHLSKASTLAQSQTSQTMTKLRSQIARRVQGPILAPGAVKRQPLLRSSPMAVQRQSRTQLQRRLPRVQGQTSTRVQGQGVASTRVNTQGLTPTRIQGQRLNLQRVQGQRLTPTRIQGQRPTTVQGQAHALSKPQIQTQTVRGQGQTLPRVQGQRLNFARPQGMRQTLSRGHVPRRGPNRVQSAAVQRSPLKSMQVSPQRQFSSPGVGLGMPMRQVGLIYRPAFAKTGILNYSGQMIPRGPANRLQATATANIRPGVFRTQG